MHERHIEFGFPFQLDGQGRMASPDPAVHLEQLVEQLLLTRTGERVNRPTLGTALDQAVFASLGPEQLSALEALVHGALQHGLGERIRVEQVRFEHPAGDRLVVRVSYHIPQHPELRVTRLDLERAF